MKTIEYCHMGEAIPDLDCGDRARAFLTHKEEGETVMHVSTDNFIYEARALIAEGIVSHENVRFLFEGKYLIPNSGGRLQEWPRGFCDHSEKAMMRILRPMKGSDD